MTGTSVQPHAARVWLRSFPANQNQASIIISTLKGRPLQEIFKPQALAFSPVNKEPSSNNVNNNHIAASRSLLNPPLIVSKKDVPIFLFYYDDTHTTAN
jgi:hypothetical protein